MIKLQIASTIPSKIIKESDINPAIALGLLCLSVLTTVGIKAAERAPSANILRNELGILYAVKKASDNPLTPRYFTMRTSRTIPKNLLNNVELPTSMVFFIILLCVSMGISFHC